MTDDLSPRATKLIDAALLGNSDYAANEPQSAAGQLRDYVARLEGAQVPGRYTVVLTRPRYMIDLDTEFGTNIQVEYVQAETAEGAIAAAKKRLFDIDAADGREPGSPNDYIVTVVFDGAAQVAQYGYDLPVR